MKIKIKKNDLYKKRKLQIIIGDAAVVEGWACVVITTP